MPFTESAKSGFFCLFPAVVETNPSPWKRVKVADRIGLRHLQALRCFNQAGRTASLQRRYNDQAEFIDQSFRRKRTVGHTSPLQQRRLDTKPLMELFRSLGAAQGIRAAEEVGYADFLQVGKIGVRNLFRQKLHNMRPIVSRPPALYDWLRPSQAALRVQDCQIVCRAVVRDKIFPTERCVPISAQVRRMAFCQNFFCGGSAIDDGFATEFFPKIPVFRSGLSGFRQPEEISRDPPVNGHQDMANDFWPFHEISFLPKC